MFRRLAIIIAPLLVAFLLPIWTVWYIGPREAIGVRAPIWRVIQVIPENVQAVGIAASIFDWHAGNLIQYFVLLTTGIAVDHLLMRKRQPQREGFAPIFPDD